MGQKEQEVVVRVNGAVITRKKLYDLMGVLAFKHYKTVISNLSPEKVKAIKGVALENAITDELIRQEGKRMALMVYKDEIEREFVESKRDFPFPELYHEFLENEGLTEEEYKKLLKDEILIKKTKEAVIGDYEISEEELKRYYEEHKKEMFLPERVRASHILIKVNDNDPPKARKEARKKIEDLREMIREGRDFGSLARAFSQCPSSKQDGDMGYLKRGDSEENFDRALWLLKEGEISSVVETKFGYHIIYLQERLKEGPLPYEDVREEMERRVKKEREDAIIAEMAERLKKASTIEVLGLC